MFYNYVTDGRYAYVFDRPESYIGLTLQCNDFSIVLGEVESSKPLPNNSLLTGVL
ncbi:MAG: hypothetical protein J6R47_03165 [Acholeplasmatales bacterium]|nr:hypothetical protein [Acholeplasmatales bacterium]